MRLIKSANVVGAWGLLTALLLANATPAAAVSGYLGLAAGYDDNPARSEQAVGSAFIGATARLSQDLELNESPLLLAWQAEATTRHYLRLADQHWADLGFTLFKPLLGGRLIPAWSLQLSSRRDELRRDESHDALLSGLDLEWLAGGGLTLLLRQQLAWQRYSDWAQFSRQSGRGRNSLHQPDEHRHDLAEGTELHLLTYPGADLDLDFFIGRGSLSSNVAREEYQRLEGGAELRWRPRAALELRLAVNVGRDSFLHLHDQLRPVNRFLTGSIGLNWRFEPLELSLQISRRENRSNLAEEEYRQPVGLTFTSWLF